MEVKIECNTPDDQEFLYNTINACTDCEASMLNDSAGHDETHYYVVIKRGK